MEQTSQKPELLVLVGSENDTTCNCQEEGKDGTSNHTEFAGVARYNKIPNLIVTAAFCENHRENYSHWEQLR